MAKISGDGTLQRGVRYSVMTLQRCDRTAWYVTAWYVTACLPYSVVRYSVVR